MSDADAIAAQPDVIELRGLRALGRHGVLDEERQRAQPFEIDLDLEVDLRRPGDTDALSDTVDYGAVTDAVRGVVEGQHSDLLEHLAQRIARAAVEAAERGGGGAVGSPGSVGSAGSGGAAGSPGAVGSARSAGSPGAEVRAVTVCVRKLRPPVPADLASAGVRIHRRRQELA